MKKKPPQTVCACMFNYNCPNRSPNMLDDVVILEQSDDDVHTASAKKRETIAQVNFITHTIFSHPTNDRRRYKGHNAFFF